MAVTNFQKLSAWQVMQDAPVIPVIVLHDVAHAVPMARALVAGGIRMLEVTLRTPQALACIQAIAREVPGAVVGAGTVRNPADAAAAAKAGAQFAVSPGYTRALGQACRDQGLPLLPGVATGSEIMRAQEDGYTELKFFPALQAGGAAMLKAAEFLALPNVACVGGSWLVPADALAQGDWTRIEALAREAAQMARPHMKS
jgi:2-dehydro-3-deoxyphosphogluconate aldolase/(4S)-4-hydroxy-2-oxoglutarate aldolase